MFKSGVHRKHEALQALNLIDLLFQHNAEIEEW